MRRRPGFALRELKRVHEYTEKAKARLDKKVVSTCEKLIDSNAKRYVFLVALEITGSHVLGTEYVTAGVAATNAKEKDDAIAQTMNRISELARAELNKLR